MTSVRAVLPISGADWESIEATHSSFFPDRERTWEHLKKKFWGCANKNMPTGDPNIPWHIQEAKEIRQLIIERTVDRQAKDVGHKANYERAKQRIARKSGQSVKSNATKIPDAKEHNHSKPKYVSWVDVARGGAPRALAE
jgi:hypothetical protein